MSKESMQQLPGSVYGVAYENAMGGVSVDPCLDDDEIEEMMESHQESELVCIVPADIYPMELIRNAPDLLSEIENLRNEANGYLKDLARHQVDATTLIGAIRRAERIIKKARGE